MRRTHLAGLALLTMASGPALAHPGSHAQMSPSGMVSHLLGQADHLSAIFAAVAVVAAAVVLFRTLRG